MNDIDLELNTPIVEINLDGGARGLKGETGQNGISPIITTSKEGKVTTITIVDAEGTKTAEIRDGNDSSGDMKKSVYDVNDNGIVDNAEKVNNHTVDADVPSNAKFTDTTYTAGPGINISGNVISNTNTNPQWGDITGTLSNQRDLKIELDKKVDANDLSPVATSGSYEDLSNQPTIPSNTSDLTNDNGFITNSVDDLTNYYKKSETYTRSEIQSLIAEIPGFSIEVVQTLPVSDIDPHTIYLLPNQSTGTNIYDEYLYINNSWELIGSTEADLSDYVKNTDLVAITNNEIDAIFN